MKDSKSRKIQKVSSDPVNYEFQDCMAESGDLDMYVNRTMFSHIKFRMNVDGYLYTIVYSVTVINHTIS